jgi:hypothetical protein
MQQSVLHTAKAYSIVLLLKTTQSLMLGVYRLQ